MITLKDAHKKRRQNTEKRNVFVRTYYFKFIFLFFPLILALCVRFWVGWLAGFHHVAKFRRGVVIQETILRSLFLCFVVVDLHACCFAFLNYCMQQ